MDRRAVLLGLTTLVAAAGAASVSRPAEALPLIDQLRGLDEAPANVAPAVTDEGEAGDVRASVEPVQWWGRRYYYRHAYWRPRYYRRWYRPWYRRRYYYRRPVYWWGPRRRCRVFRTWRGWVRRCWW